MSEAGVLTSTPSFSEFDPTHIHYQVDVMNAINHDLDFGLGVHEFLLSGSAGSAKSIILAHLSMAHLLKYPRARCLIGRQSMPDLRDTIFTKILEHIEGTVKEDGTLFTEGRDFGFSNQNCSIWFSNGSEYVSRSWANKKFKKLGSLEASIAIIEELAENNQEYWPAYQYIKMRVGRLPHVPVSWIMSASNPDGPEHPAYTYFQIGERMAGRKNVNSMRHVYFSVTADNPFLPEWYVQGLLDSLDEKMAQRMVYGLWVSIDQGKIYHAYSDRNFKDEEYKVNDLLPVYVNFDFNIGAGKPMSACFSQVRKSKDGDTVFCFFGECIVEGADTEDLLEEIAAAGVLERGSQIIVHGDATGAARSTKSKKSDYDIIKSYLAHYRKRDGSRIDFEIDVPRSNPPIRTRHNLVNGYCRNAFGKIRLFVYKPCKMLDKGMRLVAPKKGGKYIEDDSYDYQHVTTAAGYHVSRVHSKLNANETLRQHQFR